MPYFHSAINVFKWLSLSSGFVIHSRNDSLKIEEEEKKKKWTRVYFCVSSEEGSGLSWDVKPNNTSQQQLGTAERWGLHFPCSPVGGSSERKALTEGCHSVIIIYDPFLL